MNPLFRLAIRPSAANVRRFAGRVGHEGRLDPRNELAMTLQTNQWLPEPAALDGDLHELAVRVGSTDSLTSLGSELGMTGAQPITDVASLRSFLHQYQSQLLIPLEWPAILRAYGHAARQETRELLSLDRELSREPALRRFREASRAAGRSQLRKMRPLRDLRLVQRYLAQVNTGRAQGWHVVVYGIVLATYALPLRQGLLSYAWQTYRGFVEPAQLRLGIRPEQGQALLEEVGADLPRTMEGLLEAQASPRFLTV